jgi:predicted transcriptional regulator of viral defense system
MADVRKERPAERAKFDARGLAELAAQQHGVISRRQLARCGLSGSSVSRWVASGRLHPVYPHVYALGHAALSLEGRLIAALLYAGPGAALSHTTAAWRWSLIEAEPRLIHLTVPGRRRSRTKIRIHHSRDPEITECRGMPVTTVARTLVDIAAALPAAQLRRALAEADFRGLLDARAVELVLARRRPGSKALRTALQSHMPSLAQTLSVLEERFLDLCTSSGIPVPEVNARIGQMKVDAVWRERRVVVELDGAAAHRGWAAIKRDRQRELALRSLGYLVIRYTWEQITQHSDEVVLDLRGALGD